MISCACGCENKFLKYDNKGRERKYFTSGHVWNGRKHTLESKQKQRLSKIGKRNPNFGKVFSEEYRKKISLGVLNREWQHNEESKQKLRLNHLGELNPNWKGNEVKYIALHIWVKSRLPKPQFCEICKLVSPYDLANKSGKYLRDLTDWQYLCRKCHMLSDNRIFNLKQYQVVRERT